MSTTNPNVDIVFIPIDGTIGVNGEIYTGISPVYFSHLAQGIHAFHWYADVQRGEIEYSHHPLQSKPENEIITEIGDWAELVIIWNDETTRREEERQRIEAHIEASRDFWQELRVIRDYKLLISDWTQLPTAPLTTTKVTEWEAYRQKLRILPDTIEDPKPLVKDENHPDWPVPPSK
jgi:hypothetical protein